MAGAWLARTRPLTGFLTVRKAYCIRRLRRIANPFSAPLRAVKARIAQERVDARVDHLADRLIDGQVTAISRPRRLRGDCCCASP